MAFDLHYVQKKVDIRVTPFYPNTNYAHEELERIKNRQNKDLKVIHTEIPQAVILSASQESELRQIINYIRRAAKVDYPFEDVNVLKVEKNYSSLSYKAVYEIVITDPLTVEYE